MNSGHVFKYEFQEKQLDVTVGYETDNGVVIDAWVIETRLNGKVFDVPEETKDEMVEYFYSHDADSVVSDLYADREDFLYHQKKEDNL